MKEPKNLDAAIKVLSGIANDNEKEVKELFRQERLGVTRFIKRRWVFALGLVGVSLLGYFYSRRRKGSLQ